MPMQPPSGPDEPIVIPLLEEVVRVEKRLRVRRRLRVGTVTRTREQALHETLAGHGVEVERVPLGRMVSAVPPVRHEGEVTIFPVVEERLVIERRLFLVEEIRVQATTTSRDWKETVEVRYQDILVDELAGDEPDTSQGVGSAPAIME